MTAPVVPRYGASSLVEVMPAIGAHLGLPGCVDVLGLPDAERYVVLLIDGLGQTNVAASEGLAPYLASRPDTRTLTSVTPTTTATALTSLGTGLDPGQHGVAGYSFRHPFSTGVLNMLAWEPGLSGLDVQPRLTLFERLARAGIATTSVLPTRFSGSGLTEAGLRGARFSPVDDETDGARRIEQVVDASASGERSFVYVYERSLDHIGHGVGWRTEEWSAALAEVDRLAADLRSALPDATRLIITADHGMIDVPADERVIVEREPDLLAGVELLAGEGRFRQLYTAEPDAVASRWNDHLQDRAWVRTRAEAVDEAWFGYVTPQMAPRFGDVVVAMRGTGAVMTRALPRELKLIGMHGSLTADEMLVPLIVE